MDMVLTATEARVLGSLLEKERTVPATYPLTMKALISACNQSSSRDPLMDLSEADVEAAVDALKAHKLVRKVLPTHGNRSVKYRQVAAEVLTVDDPQRAVLTVLLLRGPQTPQELATRTERIHAFPDAAAVEEVLTDMAAWGDPLVRLLPRRPGQRDARWAHLLGGEPDVSGPVAPAATAPAPAGGAVSPAPPAEPVVPADPAVHGPLAPLAGTWTGPGQASSEGGGEEATWAERLEVVPLRGQPRLAWRATTRAVDDGRDLHAEGGFLRLTADGEVELVLAAASGLVEVSTGLVDAEDGGLELVLTSESVAGTPSAEPVTATERTYRLRHGTLTCEVAVAVAGQPLGPPRTATLTRT